ncbi:MAG: hypothetical protein ACREFP_12990, partial [Acetobacteraceae bacterium]
MTERRPDGLTRLREIMAPSACRSGMDIRYRLPLAVMAVLMMPALAHAQVVTGGTNPTTILNNIATFI